MMIDTSNTLEAKIVVAKQNKKIKGESEAVSICFVWLLLKAN